MKRLLKLKSKRFFVAMKIHGKMYHIKIVIILKKDVEEIKKGALKIMTKSGYKAISFQLNLFITLNRLMAKINTKFILSTSTST